MTVNMNPYLNFRSEARQAMEFYRDVLGGELTVSTFAEGGMVEDPSDADKVMHAQLATPIGVPLMASDVPSSMPDALTPNVTISLSGGPEDEAQLRGYWDGLLAGGEATLPLEKAPWGDTFGMLRDKFGVEWMVNIAGAPA
jgi:PhnB protein